MRKELDRIGFGVFAFNNRGYGLVNRFHKKDSRRIKGFRSETIGAVYEKFEDCVYDIKGAINFVRDVYVAQRGIKIILCGISTGSNKSVYYCSKESSNIDGLILLSPVSDIEVSKLDLRKKFQKEVKKAQKMIKTGKSLELMPKVSTAFPFSYQRFFSLVNTEARENTFPYIDKKPNFKALRKVKQPILVIYGSNDEYMKFNKEKALEIFKSQDHKTYSMNTKIIRGARHGFDGYEKELSLVVSNWLNLLKVKVMK